MKQFFAAAIVATFSLLPTTGFAATLYAVVTADLNMRAGPGVNYQRYATIPNGSRVAVLNCPSTTNWCLVDWRRRQGWVSRNYLAFTSQGYAPPPATVIVPPAIGVYPPYDPFWYNRYDRYDRYDRYRRYHRDRRDRPRRPPDVRPRPRPTPPSPGSDFRRPPRAEQPQSRRDMRRPPSANNNRRRPSDLQ